MGTVYLPRVALNFRDTAGNTGEEGERTEARRPVVLHLGCLIKVILATLSPSAETDHLDLGGASMLLLEPGPQMEVCLSCFFWEEHSLPPDSFPLCGQKCFL